MSSEKKKQDSFNPKLEKMLPAEFMAAIVGAAIMGGPAGCCRNITGESDGKNDAN
jgi:hypothetical protein